MIGHLKCLLLLGLLGFTSISLCAQKRSLPPVFSSALEIKFGTGFPNFSTEQSQWKAVFYPTWGVQGYFSHRFRANWAWEIGAGMHGFAFRHRGPVDYYTLDYLAPQLIGGIQYLAPPSRGPQAFARLQVGAQLGYRGTLTDIFPDYQVEVVAPAWVYAFIRPELGWQSAFQKRWKKSPTRTAFAYGVFFRYQINPLGSASFAGDGEVVTAHPKGHAIGAYWRMYFSFGRRKLRVQEAPLPPIIYSPRLQD